VPERLVHALKYEGWRALGDEMGERVARLPWPEDVREERTALVPVPLATQRARERGYNQSSLLATPLSRAYGIPIWDDVVERARQTGTQTRLTPEQRLHNVAGAFRCVTGTRSRLRGSHVILVDDVVTTAATLNECAAALWSGGARVVSYATFGRARSPGDAPLTRG
jgi:ComF family protein